jgi:hypothetical protein
LFPDKATDRHVFYRRPGVPRTMLTREDGEADFQNLSECRERQLA